MRFKIEKQNLIFRCFCIIYEKKKKMKKLFRQRCKSYNLCDAESKLNMSIVYFYYF
jgi:hypothetical protein